MTHGLAYDEVFLHLPMPVIVARRRIIVACNQRALAMFRAERTQLLGESFAVLYPHREAFRAAPGHFGPLLARHASFQDLRIMRRLDGTQVQVRLSGHAFDPDDPYALVVWAFSEPGQQPGAAGETVELTGREREVAACLVEGMTSKQIGRTLGISPRTVDIPRASLLRKHGVKATAELLRQLAS